jgi:NAD(P)-dependent dehydrogenase (short-subunit alcohol dehydrogenase family)
MSAGLRFDGRVAVVTGAGGGLGRQYALLLASRGAHVVVNDLGGSVGGDGADAGQAAKVVQEILDAGGSAVANTDSVSNPSSAENIVRTAVESFGTIDILVNNAGILRDAAFHKLAAENVDAVLDVHLRGSFFVSMPAWRIMREKGYGRIVNTSSNSGLIGNFGQSNYGAAKLGVVGLTRVLAAEGQRYGINVNAIAPAALTRMTEGLVQGESARVLDPAYVAPAVAWLVHEGCETTGEIISAGGGRVARYFIGLTPGYFSKDLSIEDVSDHWAEVRDTTQYIIPTQPAEEMAQIMEHWQ